MRSMYEQFETSTNVEKEGVWVEFGSFRVRLARAGGANKEFEKVLDRKSRPHARVIAAGLMEPDATRKLWAEVYAETVVTGWQHRESDDGPWKDGIPQRDGGVKPVNAATLVETFLALPDLFMTLRGYANELALYRAVIQENDAKNS